MSARDALASIRERAEAATEGPWVADGLEGNLNAANGARVANVAWWSEDDAQFIAHARGDVDALVGALEAVLAIHKPHRTHSPISNPDFWYSVCLTCVGPDGDHALYPCPTVVATQKVDR